MRALATMLPAALGLAAAACDEARPESHVERTALAPQREAPGAPIASPDTTGAVWQEAGAALRYGKPGEAVLMDLACSNGWVFFTRRAPADAGAKAVLALIGNGKVERLFVDAVPDRSGAEVWHGKLPADDPRLDVLAGTGRIEATVPGAGSLILNGSALPGAYLSRCRAALPPAVPAAPE